MEKKRRTSLSLIIIITHWEISTKSYTIVSIGSCRFASRGPRTSLRSEPRPRGERGLTIMFLITIILLLIIALIVHLFQPIVSAGREVHIETHFLESGHVDTTGKVLLSHEALHGFLRCTEWFCPLGWFCLLSGFLKAISATDPRAVELGK